MCIFPATRLPTIHWATNMIRSLYLLPIMFFLAACDSSLTVTDQNPGVVDIGDINWVEPDEEIVDYEPPLGFALPDRGTFGVYTTAIGSPSVGAEYQTHCMPGHILAGIAGYATTDRVHQVDAMCVEADATGNWVGSPTIQDSSQGLTSGDPIDLVCEPGNAVTGITGYNKNDTIGSLKIHCRKLVSGNETTGEEKTSALVGDSSSSVADQLCGLGGVATGVHGRANAELTAIGLICNESPAFTGRWGNPIAWPLEAVHVVLTPKGNVFTYGLGSNDYDLWKPELGGAATAHTKIPGYGQELRSFCNASIVMPESGNVLLPGGTGIDDAGIVDVPVYNPQTVDTSLAASMANRRWYPTAITLPSGEILVAGGREISGTRADTPEIYTPATNEWRSLFGANMLGLEWSYPRLWVAPDGRVFGTAYNRMFYMNTQGSGSIQRVGEFPSEYLSRTETTSVMYRPGKILQLGGRNPELEGKGALTIDINGATPEVRPTNPMRASRSAWPDVQMMADGKVLVIGGSRLNDDWRTAAMNAEIWDPNTEKWSVMSGFKWPRLYHSTSVLLKDGTVMISGDAGPGSPHSSEIFTPPYLFNADGELATRPLIDWAPQQGAYNQQITVRTSGEDVAKVSFVKTTSVTHSFNVDQRYMELSYTNTDDGIKVQLPQNANTAPPGFYMLFVLDAEGTPSEAQIIKMGNEPGGEPPPPVVVDPDPADTDVNNILVNGGFEQDKAHWLDCADPTLSSASNRASNGEKALLQNSGACLYQEFLVQPGETYHLICDAAMENSVYSSISLNMLSSSYVTLLSDSSVVAGASYTPYASSLQAPPNASIAAVTLYSEGPTHFDSCLVKSDNTAPPPPVVPPAIPETNLLANGDFSADKASWSDCAASQLTQVVDNTDTATKAMQVSSAGCIYQEFPVTPGKKYQLQCSAKSEGSRYSSINFQMASASYNELDSTNNLVGPGEFRTYTSVLTAPALSASSAVTLYSEDIAQIDACYVSEI